MFREKPDPCGLHGKTRLVRQIEVSNAAAMGGGVKGSPSDSRFQMIRFCRFVWTGIPFWFWGLSNRPTLTVSVDGAKGFASSTPSYTTPLHSRTFCDKQQVPVLLIVKLVLSNCFPLISFYSICRYRQVKNLIKHLEHIYFSMKGS